MASGKPSAEPSNEPLSAPSAEPLSPYAPVLTAKDLTGKWVPDYRIRLDGSEFAPNEKVTITVFHKDWGPGGSSDFVLEKFRTLTVNSDAEGRFRLDLQFGPDSESQSYAVEAVGALSHTPSETEFGLAPWCQAVIRGMWLENADGKDITSIEAGQTVRVMLDGYWAPDGTPGTVYLDSTDVPLGKFVIERGQNLLATVTVPAGIEPGKHRIIAVVDTEYFAETARMSHALTVTAAGGSDRTLPVTGTDAGPLMVIGAALICAGAAFLVLRRRTVI